MNDSIHIVIPVRKARLIARLVGSELPNGAGLSMLHDATAQEIDFIEARNAYNELLEMLRWATPEKKT